MMSLYSCSGLDEDEGKIQHISSKSVNKGLQTKADSADMTYQSGSSRDTINLEGSIILSDPPPKDRDQWKVTE